MDKHKDEGGAADHHRAEESSWSWKRKPLQGHNLEIAFSYRKKVLKDIESVLTDVGGEKLLQQFVDGCFGHLLRFVGGGSCNMVLRELINHEITVAGARDNELWFRIGEANIRFAPAEYALITGLHFGSSSFDPLGSHEMPPEGVFNRFCSGLPINGKELWSMFNERRLIRQPEDYLKVAHVLALNLVALGYDQLRTVERWVWALVDDLDAWNRFPWGAYTYQALMHYVRKLPTERGQDSLKFYGPVWALQIWAYEAIPCLGDKYALATKDVSMPRFLNWSFPGVCKKFPKQFLEEELDCFVTLEPRNEEKLQPYWLSVQTEQPLSVRYASPRSQKRGLPRPRRVSTYYYGLPDEPDYAFELPVSRDSSPEPPARPSRSQAPDLRDDRLQTDNPGWNGDRAKGDEKNDGGSSSISSNLSSKTLADPSTDSESSSSESSDNDRHRRRKKKRTAIVVAVN